MASATQIIQRRRRREERQQAKQARLRMWMLLVAALGTILVVVPGVTLAGGALMMYIQATRTLPEPLDTIYLDPIVGQTRLYDRSGQTMLFSVQDPLGDQRTWIPLESLPSVVVDATLLMEDPDFLTRPRPGLLPALVKLWQNALNGPLPIDPTLTGRLVRNAIVQPGEVVTAAEREREIALVAEINRRYSPEQILEWHLNTDFYGNEAYGIEAAAQVYLGKHAVDLKVDEAALLAAIPLAPQYNPIDSDVAARGRQDDVLRALVQAKKITSEDYDFAVTTQTPVLDAGGQLPDIAPQFALYARRQAKDILDALGLDGARLVSRGGLRITTTLDLDLYSQAECALRAHLNRLAGDSTPVQTLDGQPCASALYLPPLDAVTLQSPPDSGALTILDAQTGEIMSMVGPVAEVAYQPGPTLQPFVYFEGFRTGETPADMVLDIPRPLPGAVEGLIYTPANPDGLFRGPINLREAMSAWLLPPAVQLANEKRLDNILGRAHLLGLNSLDENARYDLSLLERGGQVSVLDMAYAYSVLSSMGDMRGVQVDPIGRNYRGRDPVSVLRIEDASGEVLWDYAGDQYEPDCAAASNCTELFPEELGYLVNHILADQTTRARVLGQNQVGVLDTDRPAALVNGSTSDRRDAWTLGYTPRIVTAVHLGRSDGASMTIDALDRDGSAPVWRAIMDYVANRDALQPEDWPRPENVADLVVCERSGLLPNGVCPTRRELFIRNIQPTRPDTYWQAFDINSQTNQLATVNTPAGLRSERVYFIPPPEAMDWWEANNQPLPPTEYDTVSRPELLGGATLLQPGPFAYVGGVVDVRGSLDPTNMRFYQLAYGQGLNPLQWTQIGPQQTEYTRGASLGTWATTGLDGLYSLRLTVVLSDNSLETDVRQVTIDNQPPTVTLTSTQSVYRWPGDRVITLNADVTDNLAIERVEFYYNGEFIGTDEEWPYGFEWDISRTGTERFGVVAFDAVANQADAEITVTVERASG
ncbi:MAG: transglycosylase domain-containing protein [Anaerolineae bacterium]|nr:transglycosylase domain-containing protein [Anaerolineae bacterium]